MKLIMQWGCLPLAIALLYLLVLLARRMMRRDKKMDLDRYNRLSIQWLVPLAGKVKHAHAACIHCSAVELAFLVYHHMRIFPRPRSVSTYLQELLDEEELSPHLITELRQDLTGLAHDGLLLATPKNQQALCLSRRQKAAVVQRREVLPPEALAHFDACLECCKETYELSRGIVYSRPKFHTIVR